MQLQISEGAPQLDDEQKLSLCRKLESIGLLYLDVDCRWRITDEGHLAGAMLLAAALHEIGERH